MLHNDGCYGLNLDAGINTDVRCFDVLARWGHQQWLKGNRGDAVAYYHSALRLYMGDLYSGTSGTDVFLVIERERLRVGYLTVLSRLAEYYYLQNEDDKALDFAQLILSSDPCREDAHRLMMRCYFRRGERAQAIRQYHLCSQILRMEFDTIPEPDTTKLYGQLLAGPDNVWLSPGPMDSVRTPASVLLAGQSASGTEAVDK
ncbi:MAG: bacterial transcriptional activator domain-containing protein [Chloroflexia bacterium]